ncbi:MAG TPA: hypothetical protein ENN58_03555 [bacterium]|nr:hypothetical protein [bacterium]
MEYTRRAVKDLKSFAADHQKKIIQETIKLGSNPLPLKKKVKRIHGIRFPCYRLRMDIGDDSLKVFYGIKNELVFILRIISKKDADQVLKRIKDSKVPPEIKN